MPDEDKTFSGSFDLMTSGAHTLFKAAPTSLPFHPRDDGSRQEEENRTLVTRLTRRNHVSPRGRGLNCSCEFVTLTPV